MRCLPRLSGKSVFAGDIVAFKPPPGVDGDLLIRRVAAVEGEELISDDPEDEAFHLKQGRVPQTARECSSYPAAQLPHAELRQDSCFTHSSLLRDSLTII